MNVNCELELLKYIYEIPSTGSTSGEYYYLLARVYIQHKKYKKAMQSLNSGMSSIVFDSKVTIY